MASTADAPASGSKGVATASTPVSGPNGDQETKDRKERQTRRLENEMVELRAKLERDKQEALFNQKEAMNRAFRVQLAKLVKEKEELIRKCQQQQMPKNNPVPVICPVELQKLTHENTILRLEKKKQDEQLQLMKESEQHRFENMRSLLDDKARELNHLQKQLRQQIARLREETRAKDRVISTLEAELRIQTGRAQQFRDILEQNLFSSCGCRSMSSGLNERDDLIVRERKLVIQVEDLREKMRQQQNNFSAEKQELLRRLNETERQQSPLRKKTKEVLTRNVELAAKNTRLTETLKVMQQQQQDATNLKRSLTRPNVNSLGVPNKNDKHRRVEYVQQVQKLRKDQRFFSMWELPPLLEVETDSAADVSGASEGSLSPAATSGVTSCSDAWSEETRRELEMLFSQLTREHSELQRSYQMLHEKLHQLTCFSDADAANVNYATLQTDYNAARARIRDLEEILQLKQNHEDVPRPQTPTLLEIQAKFVREKHTLQTQIGILTHQLQESKNKFVAVQAELNESRDQNELLEFRILELEELQERQASSRCYDSPDRKDVCTDTDSDDLSVGDSGITSLAVDCPSPTSSVHAGSQDGDFLIDKISTVKGEVQILASSLSDASQKSILTQLQALLGVCQARLIHGSKTSRNSVSNWDWQLQESGIFEEEHDLLTPRDSSSSSSAELCIQVAVPLLSTTRHLEEIHSQMEAKSIQTEAVRGSDRAVQTTGELCAIDDGVVREAATFADCPVQCVCDQNDGQSQTEETVMTLKDFRDIEGYYIQQVEILQKEKAAMRKKLQSGRDETAQSLQELEALTGQCQEREKQFEQILQSNCQSFERELEVARRANSAELCALREALQLVWQEMKDYVYASPDMLSDASCATEFAQAVTSSLHSLCNELKQLRSKVAQLEEMEQAFQTTLQQADGLVQHIEQKHLRRIRELELTEHELRSQLEHVEMHGDRSGYVSPGGGEVGHLEAKIRELESENCSLSIQVNKAQEVENYCQQMRNRIDELEQREMKYKMTLQEADRRFTSRELRYREETDSLRIDLEKFREKELLWQQRLEQKEAQLTLLRSELEAERKIILGLEKEVKELSSKIDKEDTSFRNEATKLRSQISMSLAQLNELEFLNCQLREQLADYQERLGQIQRSLDKETSLCENLMAENQKLQQQQMEVQSHNEVPVAKPLTEELLEAELNTNATLDDFREISLPSTPTVLEGCTNMFEEHFKVLESLENYLESQQLVPEDNDESGISTSPSIHENESLAALEAQLLQLRSEKRFLLNSVVNSQKKDEIIQILINQLKYNAPRQYLMETAAHIRQMTVTEPNAAPVSDKEIDRVCHLLEAPIDLADVTESSQVFQPVDSVPKVVKTKTTKAKLPAEDPLLSPPTDLRVTRKVGQDGLVIAWLPSPDPECTGYLICVNGQETQRVRSAQRTKAVLCGLDLLQEMEICIYSLSVDGLISTPDRALFSPVENPNSNETVVEAISHAGSAPLEMQSNADGVSLVEVTSPREVVVQTFYTNSSVTVRSSRRLTSVTGSRIPVRSCVP